MSEDLVFDYSAGCGDVVLNLDEYPDNNLALNFINDAREDAVSQFMVSEDIVNDSITITRISGIPTSNSKGIPMNSLITDHFTINRYFTIGKDKITFIGQNYNSSEIKTLPLEEAIGYPENNPSVAFSIKTIGAGVEFQGSFLGEKIKGTSSADTIYGNDGDDYIDGGSGNDTIYGGYGDDYLMGGAGNDVIYAQFGKNRISDGAGDDIIYGANEGDNISVGQGSDTIYAGKGDDIIYVNSLANGNRNTIYANDGDDTIYSAGASKEAYRETVNGKLVKHLTSADTINAIYGENGSDTFIIQGIYGTHIIKDASKNDILQHSLMEGAEYSYTRNGNDLNIIQTYSDSLGDIQTQTIILENHFSMDNPIEKFTIGEVEKDLISEVTLNIALVEGETYSSSKYKEIISGSGIVSGLNSLDAIKMDGDVSYSRYNSGADLIISNGTDTITVKNYFSPNNTFDKIIVNNEELSIKERNFDIYVTENYEGLLVNENIINNSTENIDISGSLGKNTYRFKVNCADASLRLSGQSDAIIFEKDTTSVTPPVSSTLSYIENGEDLIIRRTSKYNLQVGGRIIEDEIINNVVIKDFIKEANLANNKITVQLEDSAPVVLSLQTLKLSGREEIIATSFNEEITGSEEDDIIYAGKGKDTINPLGGENTIVFNVGDAVEKNVINSSSGIDTIQFIDKDNYSNIYTIDYTNNSGVLTSLVTRNALNSNGSRIVDLIEIKNASKNNILLFGEGRNTIKFTRANFLYNTTISTHGDDVLDFGDIEIAINPSLDSKDLVITVADGAQDGSVIIKNYLENKNSDASVIAHEIYSWKLSQIQINTALTPNKKGVIQGSYAAEIIKGVNGQANTIYAEGGDDIVIGGSGNDKIYAGEGINTIIFNKGDGKDMVYSNGGYDTIEFYGINEDDNFKLTESGKNLVISYGDENDSVTLVGFLQDNHSVKALNVYSSAQNANEKVLNSKYSIPDLTTNRTNFLVVDATNTKKKSVTGSSLSETIIGSNKNNVIKAGGGDDIIYTYSGKNTVYTQSREGDNSTIYLGAGKDKVYTGKGTDTLVFNQGHSSDTIIANSEGTANLDFSTAGVLSFSINKNDLIIKNTYDISGAGRYVTESATIKNYLKGKLTNNINIIDDTGVSKNLYEYITELQNNDSETITQGNPLKKKSQKINGSFLNETFYGGVKKDVIKLSAGVDIVYATNGKDRLYGYTPTDIDKYNEHAKTFVYNIDFQYNNRGDIISASGKGSDVMYYTKSSDKIVFNVYGAEEAEYLAENIKFKKSKNNLIITYNTYKKGKKTVSDSITIVNYFKQSQINAINSIEFTDVHGVDLSQYNINLPTRTLYMSASGKVSDTNYSDIITGSSKKNTYNISNGGDDVIYDSKGNDTYNITLKDSAVVNITDNAGKDVLNFKNADSIIFGVNIDTLGNITDDNSIILLGFNNRDENVEGYIKVNNYINENKDGSYSKGKGAIETFKAGGVKVDAFDLNKINEIKLNVASFFAARSGMGYTDTVDVFEKNNYLDVQALVNCYRV